MFQMAGLPWYVLKITVFTTKLGIGLMQMGGFILKGEYTLANLAWVPADFLLFGEWVSPTGNQTFCIVANETINEVYALTGKFLGEESSD